MRSGSHKLYYVNLAAGRVYFPRALDPHPTLRRTPGGFSGDLYIPHFSALLDLHINFEIGDFELFGPLVDIKIK